MEFTCLFVGLDPVVLVWDSFSFLELPCFSCVMLLCWSWSWTDWLSCCLAGWNDMHWDMQYIFIAQISLTLRKNSSIFHCLYLWIYGIFGFSIFFLGDYCVGCSFLSKYSVISTVMSFAHWCFVTLLVHAKQSNACYMNYGITLSRAL